MAASTRIRESVAPRRAAHDAPEAGTAIAVDVALAAGGAISNVAAGAWGAELSQGMFERKTAQRLVALEGNATGGQS